MRRTHSPGGATTAEFFVGVIFRVSIRKTCYNFEMEEFLASFCVARVCQRQLGFLFLSVVNDVVLYDCTLALIVIVVRVQRPTRHGAIITVVPSGVWKFKEFNTFHKT